MNTRRQYGDEWRFKDLSYIRYTCVNLRVKGLSPAVCIELILSVPTLLHIKIIKILSIIQGAIVDSPLIYKLKVGILD